MNLCTLIDRMEYALFALVLLPTFLVIGAAVVSLADVARAMESELLKPRLNAWTRTVRLPIHESTGPENS